MCCQCIVFLFDCWNLNLSFYITIKNNYDNHCTETLLSKRCFKVWSFDGSWVYILRLIRSATWIWNRPMVELLGRLLPKYVHTRGIQRTGIAITEACLNSPNPVHGMSLVLNLYYFDIILQSQVSTIMCIAYFTIRLPCPVFRILDVAV
jgi:hypothetical protein